MIIDIHSHMINKNFNLNKFKHNFTTKMFFLKLKVRNYQEYYKKMTNSLNESPIDKTVLCAIENTWCCSDNKQTAEICKNNPNFLYGTNLNPTDKEIENKVEQEIKNNAVLVKIIPSFQNIDLSDKNCSLFFEILKENKLPLLVHTGIEHTVKGGNQELNNPKKLEPAAKNGNIIIAAHCGSKLNFWERDYFDEWSKLAYKYENFYGDLSAMIPFYRKDIIKKLLKDKTLCSKLIFGTDFPSYPFPNINKHNIKENIFSDWYYFFKEIGFDNDIFNRAEKILNL